MNDDFEEGFRAGIPNESMLPQLHVLSFRRNHTLNNNKLIKKADIND
jgi:hypothetical protein